LGILGGLGILGILRDCGEKEGEKGEGNLNSYFLYWLGIPIIISWIISLKIPNYQPFRLLLVLPAFYLIIAGGIDTIKNQKTKYLTAGCLVILNLIFLSIYYFNPYFWREDWRSLANFLKTKENSITIIPSNTSDWPIRYYDYEGKIKLVGGIGAVGEIRDFGNVENSKIIYYVRYLVPLFDPEEKILAKLGEAGYTKKSEISFNQVPLWLFVKK